MSKATGSQSNDGFVQPEDNDPVVMFENGHITLRVGMEWEMWNEWGHEQFVEDMHTLHDVDLSFHTKEHTFWIACNQIRKHEELKWVFEDGRAYLQTVLLANLYAKEAKK
jgi:hypothetical protein